MMPDRRFICNGCGTAFEMVEVNVNIFAPRRFACISGMRTEYCNGRTPVCPKCRGGDAREVRA